MFTLSCHGGPCFLRKSKEAFPPNYDQRSGQVKDILYTFAMEPNILHFELCSICKVLLQFLFLCSTGEICSTDKNIEDLILHIVL